MPAHTCAEPSRAGDPEDLAAMVDVNMRAPLVLTAAALPYLRRAGGGAVVMVGSLAGCAPLQGAATYSATKAGLRTFAYALADELRDSNISVGVVSPGPIDTGFIMDDLDQVEDIVFSQPMSSAQQVARAVLKLASGRRTEIAMPASSGILLNLFYLSPWLRRRAPPDVLREGAQEQRQVSQSARTAMTRVAVEASHWMRNPLDATHAKPRGAGNTSGCRQRGDRGDQMSRVILS